MKDLIERLEAATGADRELDLCVSQVCGVFYSYTDTPNGPKNIACRPYTASLDASLALVGEKLPGWRWSIGGPYPSGLYRAGFVGSVEADWQAIHAPIYARTPALAVLIALLKALRALETK